MLKKGGIYHIKDFKFENGESKNKYAIILSSNDTFIDILFTLTTSLVEKYKQKLPQDDFYIIPAGKYCFSKETMIIVTRIEKFTLERFIRLSYEYKDILDEWDFKILKEKILLHEKVLPYYKKYIL